MSRCVWATDPEHGAYVVTDSPLGRIVREIMACGFACASEHLRDVDMDAPLSDILGNFPDEFLRYRPGLVDDLRAVLEAPDA